MRYASLAALLLILLAVPATAADQTLLLRQPDLSDDHIAFVYAGDLWVASPDGSAPRRLTTSPVDEQGPVFSPDGKLIAYAAAHESNYDVYVIPVEGGQPTRLTWHPGPDLPMGWTPDGKEILFSSSRESDHGRSAQLYHVPLKGGAPVKQMEARFFQGAYDETGERLAYIAHMSGYNALFGGAAGWKGYRGGTTPEIRIMDLARQTVLTIPGAGATNFNPMWVDGVLYFISDREKELYNIYRWDPAAGEPIRVSNERVWDVRAAGGHDGAIVYEAGGHLKRLDLASGRTTEIDVHIAPDLPQLRPQWKSASRAIQDIALSATGKRALVTARGEVFTIPVEDGSTRNITGTESVREYTALWSPDGGRIAYIVESLDGQTLVIVDQDGGGERETHKLGSYFYRLMAWGGEETSRIVLADNHLTLYVFDVEDGKLRELDTATRREGVGVALSPDGAWLAYTREQPNYQGDLVLANLDDGTTAVVTDGMADVSSPAFSPDGKYLFFAASTNSGPIQVGLNMTSQEKPYRAGLYAAVLAADGESPLLPESGDEEVAEDEDDAEKEDADKEDDDEKKDEEEEGTKIDLEGLSDRIVALPVAERNYGNLAAGHDGALYYVQRVQPGGTHEPPGSRANASNALYRFDMEEKEASSLLSGVNGFTVSADGKHALIMKTGGSLVVADLGASLSPEPVDMGGLRVRIDPRAEWAQIFDEAWRMEKEFFYAPSLHGLDWKAIYKRYRPLVDHVGRREDLNDLIREMVAELQVGHNYVAGGDTHDERGVGTGLLGANFTIEDGLYRFARVYGGESWNPFAEAPLAVPGNEIREGEYLLAVNGRDLSADDNVWAFLQGTQGEQVTLRVGPKADGEEARDVVVEPTGNERQIRLWNWIEANRRRVEEATDGRVGYIYLPNTAGAGYTFFNRMFYAQVDKEALIIDERANAGGQAADYIVETLARRHLSGWQDRDGLSYNTPAGAVHGPKVMLIDQDAGSGGDYLPYAFRQLDTGKLIGKRTWGGLIGISTNPPLVDGGFLTVPFFRFFNADGRWSVENQGVAPDIEVELDPIATNRGVDTQLEAAIEEILSELKDFVPTVPTKTPAYPTEPGE